jgi:FkbM family methyltransferase
MMGLIDRFFLKQPRLRRCVTRLLEGDRELDISVLGTDLRVHTIREHGFLRSSRRARSSLLFRDELPVILNLAGLLSENDTFVDIGANVGIYSLTLARMRRLLSGTHFHAFEPNPDTFSRLNAHAPELGVRAYNVALSDHEGTLEFVEGAMSNVFTTVENAASWSLPDERQSVPCKRLDQFELEGDSIILKIDVEGQEMNVLQGAVEFFSRNRIKAVYLDGYKEKEVAQFLERRGFEFFDGRTLKPAQAGVFSLLAVRKRV